MLSFREFIDQTAASRFSGIFPSQNHDLKAAGFIGVTGEKESLSTSDFPEFDQDWHIGYIAYEHKNQIEKLTTAQPDRIGWPESEFWTPQTSEALHPTEDDAAISWPPPRLRCSHTREEYLRCFASLKDHIQKGDIYEINFCIRFEAEGIDLDPGALFQRMYHRTMAPYTTFYKSGDRYLLCMSPELYLRKENGFLISEPMKGTCPRGLTPEQDLLFRDALLNSEKEKTENIMITDLVRNDLSKVAQRGSVRVPEFCAIRTFHNVHQMISKVQCRLRENTRFKEIVDASFPMGSMTGAPKIRAMELAERFEKGGRGLFSGAVGYLSPDGNLQFAVVIRSVFYHRSKKYLSFSVGSAITAGANAMEEYQECLLKAKGIFEALGTDIRTFV